jgi:hypothetical protein
MFPGIVLYMSSFYKRHSLQYRVALMFSTTSLAGAFSGLLAAGIQNLAGAKGLPGWAWIFILVRADLFRFSQKLIRRVWQEGVFTILWGIASYFILPRTPETALWLTPEEKTAYVAAMRKDWSGDAEHEPFAWKYVLQAVKSPFVLLLGIPLFFSGMLFILYLFKSALYISQAPRYAATLTVHSFASHNLTFSFSALPTLRRV